MKTIAIKDDYDMEPYFGGNMIGWIVIEYEDERPVKWQSYSKLSNAISYVKAEIRSGYSFQWVSTLHAKIMEEIEAGV